MVTATVDLDDIVSYRGAIASLREQASAVERRALGCVAMTLRFHHVAAQCMSSYSHVVLYQDTYRASGLRHLLAARHNSAAQLAATDCLPRSRGGDRPRPRLLAVGLPPAQR